ncbi:protein translocase subunit SecD [Janibacter sp. YIM B02568]|uniref:protein translocase subunit SecD n=1 Tax=Janibacter endophyticus TaxID=2806261 RepID=UPI00194F2CD7|nr:protein translocase subunit SecD [Janibacter endophyticus]MBM6546329.1 protein translocase subunit SecD [Janibacter endophyticus]
MASRTGAESRAKDVAKRSLVWLFVAIGVLTAALGFGVARSDASWAPELGLDLQGGTQFILEPVLEGGQDVSSQQLEQARDIIVQRIDAQGTSGAEVTTLGGQNIVVAMAGRPTEAQRNAITSASQMQFRPVLATMPGTSEPAPEQTGPEAPAPSGPATSGETRGPSADEASPTSASRDEARTAPATTTPSPSSTTPSPSSTPAETGPATSTEPAPAGDSWTPTGEPKGPTDPNNISTELYEEFLALDCEQRTDTRPNTTPDQAIVACDDDGATKYILGPQMVPGSEIKDAAAGYRSTQQGQITNEVEINLTFGGDGVKRYADVSRELVALPSLSNVSPVNPPGSYNALATVYDGTVLVAPYFNEAIPNGTSSISGSFTIEEARALAQSLKFGALPMTFETNQAVTISPTLGSEQLRYGIIAGILGLLAVIVYSVFQYRVLALVTIGSMVIAFGITYLAIALLSWGYGYRLDMAGVTGLIIAIGVTADSFIVYFERVRDELREGRNVRAAVEAGWARAKRTILVADGVNFIAAVVLYVLASSGVRGFAFTLGLTTLIDLAVFWLFTHPLLTLLARRKFFSSGHRWSGLEVESLQQAGVRYRGRGQFDVPEERQSVRPGVTSDGGAVV